MQFKDEFLIARRDMCSEVASKKSPKNPSTIIKLFYILMPAGDNWAGWKNTNNRGNNTNYASILETRSQSD